MANANGQIDVTSPKLLVLNQMAGPMTWELAVDLVSPLGSLALLTGHPDTLAKEPPPGLHITAATSYRRGGFLARVWSWAKYMAHAFVWLWKWPSNTPVLVFSNPPMGLWVALLMKLLRGTPYAVMVHDIYPDVAVRMGVISEKNPLVWIWNRINRFAYERANIVMTLGENMAEVLRPQFDAARTNAGKTHVVYPWADTDRFHPLPKNENPFAKQHDQIDKLTVMYSGNMGLGHDVETMIAAAERLQNEPRLHFMFIGAGPKWEIVEQAIEQKQLNNVTLLPWQDESIIPQSLATADIAFVSLEPEMAALAIPSKAFYFLAAGTPLLVLSPPNTELATIINDFQCGWVYEPGDCDKLVETLTAVCHGKTDIAELQVASRNAATSVGNRQRNTQRLFELLANFVLPSDDANPSTPATEELRTKN